MSTESPQPKRRGYPWLLALGAVAGIVVPALFWRGTWFGRVLSNDEIENYLAETDRPRHVQHALSQISDRVTRGDKSVERYYPRVRELAKEPSREIRITVAWVLGQDTNSPEARGVLQNLLEDSEPMVRRNAALALVRFGDDSGHDVILAMLRPYTQVSPAAGTVKLRLEPDDSVDVGTLLARIESQSSETIEVRSEVPGRVIRRLVDNNATVEHGTPLFLLAPSEDELWEALRALYLIGRSEDIAEVTSCVGAGIDVSPRVRQQAALTTEAIRSRSPRG